MSYAVGTTHYNLPQTQGTDKRDWSDTNQAFADIDAAIYEAGDDASTALSTAQTAQTTATSAASDASTAVTTANGASATAQTASEAAALARTEAQSASTVAGQANTTAQAAQATASNADTVALAAQAAVGDLTTLTTVDKTSAVAAINEVNKTVNDSVITTLVNSTDTTMNSDGVVVVNFQTSGAQYGGATLYVNGVAVMAYGQIGTTNEPITNTFSYKVKKGDVVNCDINTAYGTTGSGKVYALS